MTVLSQTYECLQIDALGDCTNWQIVTDNDVTPLLTQSEQNELLLAVLSVMVLVWLFKMLQRAISYF